MEQFVSLHMDRKFNFCLKIEFSSFFLFRDIRFSIKISEMGGKYVFSFPVLAKKIDEKKLPSAFRWDWIAEEL